MRNSYKFVLPVLAAVLVASSAYAAKPETTSNTEKVNGYAKMTVEQKAEAKALKAQAKANRVKPVTQVRLYPTLAGDTAPATFDYENQPWAKMVVNTRNHKVNLVGHNLEANTEYTVKYGDQVVGVPTMSNEDSVLHVKSSFTADHEGVITDWKVYKGEEVVLTGSLVKIKGIESGEEE